VGGTSESVVVTEFPRYVAVIVAVCVELTALVVTVKVADVAPAGMLTIAGTVAAVELEDRETTAPPAGAAAVKSTVPWMDCAPDAEVAESVTL
jgi:hypothetical protein